MAAMAASAQVASTTSGPDRREIPVPRIKTPMGILPGVTELPVHKDLPDIMVSCDPQDQRDRLTEQMTQNAAGDAEADLLDEDFIQAMEAGMPPMGGIGVGIDRLTMFLTGRDSIRDVILFPTLKNEKAA